MVWTAIVLAVLLIISASIAFSEYRYAQELQGENENLKIQNRQLKHLCALLTSDCEGRDAEIASLRKHLEQKSNKPEEKVIHARNAGDVRRKFEQAIGEKP